MNEIKRLHGLQKIVEQQMTASVAAELLGLSLRQVRRLVARFRQQGAKGVIHGNRGRAPINRIRPEIESKVLELAEKDFRILTRVGKNGSLQDYVRINDPSLVIG